jgi:hypothetical protein
MRPAEALGGTTCCNVELMRKKICQWALISELSQALGGVSTTREATQSEVSRTKYETWHSVEARLHRNWELSHHRC